MKFPPRPAVTCQDVRCAKMGTNKPGAGLTLSGSLCTFSMYDSKVLQGWRLLSVWFWILLNELNKLLPKSYALSNTSSGSKAGKKCTTSAVSAVIAAERRVMVTFWWWLDDTMTIIAAALQQHCMTACSSFMFTQQQTTTCRYLQHPTLSCLFGSCHY